MATKDFVVKNGLQAATQVWVGNNTVNVFINSTSFSGIANNSLYLGGTAAAVFVKNTDSRTLSGNLVFSGANISFSGANITFNTVWKVGANVYANTTAIFVGNATQNAYVTSTGLYVNGQIFQSGGGYYKGNSGAVGNTNNKANLFRINSNTMSANITVLAGENAVTTGPIVISPGITLTVDTGGRAVIV